MAQHCKPLQPGAPPSHTASHDLLGFRLKTPPVDRGNAPPRPMPTLPSPMSALEADGRVLPGQASLCTALDEMQVALPYGRDTAQVSRMHSL